MVAYIVRAEPTKRNLNMSSLHQPDHPSPQFIYPPKPQPGERVAILSPSSGLPGLFPSVFEQGLRRLREEFHLAPIEYPTTRMMGSSLEARARDVHAAFADPDIKAIICSIGGDDEIKLLRYLDPAVLKAHPKPFLGYSDNTNLHLLLWNLGIVSYYGGSILVQFGRGGAMNPYSAESLRHALFTHGVTELTAPATFTDEDADWDDPQTLTQEPRMFENNGWAWRNADRVVEGIPWGGDLTILHWNLAVDRYLLPNEAYTDTILCIETDEELPPAEEVYRMLMCMGERGLLGKFVGVLVARPKAWSFTQRHTPEEKATFIQQQQSAILRALDEYNPAAMVVFNLDFGHTDPQCVIPLGGHITIDGPARRIFVTY